MEKILPVLQKADTFLTIGTSGVVYPAAGFLQAAKQHGAHTVCINREPIPQGHIIDEFIQGLAAMEVPGYLDTLT
jgi:NAD-dependent deacetylase